MVFVMFVIVMKVVLVLIGIDVRNCFVMWLRMLSVKVVDMIVLFLLVVVRIVFGR